jgi:hypothetical protein
MSKNESESLIKKLVDELYTPEYTYDAWWENDTGDFIMFDGSFVSGPDTSMGLTFSTTISLLDYGTASGTYFDKSRLIDLLVYTISDNRDGTMSMMPSNLIISGSASTISTINLPGTYSVTFNFSDIAHNTLEGVHMDLTITA